MSQEKMVTREKLIVGNWKMNGDRATFEHLISGILGARQADEAQMVVCPPFTHLECVARWIDGTDLVLGAQNISKEDQGAFTGEISSKMLQDFGCKFVIIGHNERRRMQGETDIAVAEKCLAALRGNLTPIVCCGESIEDRNKGAYLEVISRQLGVVVNSVGSDQIKKVVFAYEPVWAVGTGKVASPEQVSEVHRFIRDSLKQNSEEVKILYGGSVKVVNAKELFMLPDVDGALLGGASLDAQEFLAIARIAKNSR